MFILDNVVYNVTLDWTKVALTKLFVIIAVLQLVKKIPDIINTIFGTHIQSRGGIKGRLGEMAGIGGIAQKAWTSLGTGAKNLAKIGLAAPFVATGFGANQAYKSKTGKNLTDHKTVRGIRAGLSGVGTALKTGNVMKAYETGKATFEKTSTDPRDKARFMQRTNKTADDILTDEGTDVSAVKDQNFARKRAKEEVFEKNISSVGGEPVKMQYENYQRASRRHSIASQIGKYNDAVEKNLQSAMNTYAQGSDQYEKIKAAFNAYEASGDQRKLAKFVIDNNDLFKDKTIVTNLIGANGALTSKERALEFIAANKDDFQFSTADLENLKRGSSAVGFVATTAKESVEKTKNDLDLEIAGARISELEKFELNSSISNAIDLTNSEAFAIGRKDAENKMQGTSMDRGDLGGDYWTNEFEKPLVKRLVDLREKAHAPGGALTPDEEKEYNELLSKVKEMQKNRRSRS